MIMARGIYALDIYKKTLNCISLRR